MKRKYTVILLRPGYLTRLDVEDHALDTYIAYIEAETVKKAFVEAQQEMFRLDTEDGLNPSSPSDYRINVAFRGHPVVAAFEWQLPTLGSLR